MRLLRQRKRSGFRSSEYLRGELLICTIVMVSTSNEIFCCLNYLWIKGSTLVVFSRVYGLIIYKRKNSSGRVLL